MKYSELITLGVVTFGVALNAKCNNTKYDKSIFSKPSVHMSQFIDYVQGGGGGEKKDNTFNYEVKNNCYHMHYVIKIS